METGIIIITSLLIGAVIGHFVKYKSTSRYISSMRYENNTLLLKNAELQAQLKDALKNDKRNPKTGRYTK